jgi:hypothetical protein
MPTSIRYSTISRISGAVAALWLCGGGAAWAGDGGDFGSLKDLLKNGSTGLCDVFDIEPCPIPPTITQAALEVAALGNSLFQMLLLQNNILPTGSRVYAGNPAAVIPGDPDLPGCGAAFPLSSTTTPTVQDCLSTLTPLAFISQNPGTAAAQPTQLHDARADSFLYAVATGPSGSVIPIPNAVYFFYETLFRTNQNGTIAASFSFPLSVLYSDGTKRAVPTTLNFTGTSGGDCSASTVSGDFSGTGSTTPITAGAIGIDCTVVFSASPTSTQKHAIFEVKVLPLVTPRCSATVCPDPLYFYSSTHSGAPPNPVNSGLKNSMGDITGQGIYTAFNQEVGYAAGSGVLGTGIAIGLAPNAGSLPAPSAHFSSALCARLPVNTNGAGAQLRPAIGAFYAMATSGEMLLAAPLPSAFILGGSPPGCP